MDSSIRHILVRHEQGAGHAAQGYAAATGRVGVCMATCGPGATNLVTPIADAYMDSVPIVAVTGQVGAASIGTDAFQEADIRGITMPITKHNFLVTDPAEIPRTIAEAFYIASTGRPGPVLVDVAKSALQARPRSSGRASCCCPAIGSGGAGAAASTTTEDSGGGSSQSSGGSGSTESGGGWG